LNLITQGLEISIIGITITFLALGVFILIMFVLKRLFPSKPVANEDVEGEDQETNDYPSQETQAENSQDQEIAVAIAVAVNYFQTQGQTQLGGTLQEGRGAWWISNQMSGRQKSGLHINRSAK